MRRLRLPAPSRRQAGAAAVEFALLFPLFMIIVFGIIDMGFAFNQKINLTQATREASRFGATLGFKASAPGNTGNIDTWLLQVQNVTLSAGGSDVAAGRANRYVCVAYVAGGSGTTKSLTIGTGGPSSNQPCFSDGRSDNRVQIEAKSDTALDVLLFGGSITVGDKSTTHFEAVEP